MYFTPEPKTEARDLFGVEFTLQQTVDLLKAESTRLVVIKGLRRTGKTSLLNVSLKESGLDFVKLDVREGPYHDQQEFLSFAVGKIQEKFGKPLLQRIMEHSSGVKVGYGEASATIFFSKEKNIQSFFSSLNTELAKKKRVLIMAIDEVQLLKKIGFDYLVASIFDNYKNIKMIVTGSEIGLVDIFLGKQDYDAPLFGRAFGEIELQKLASGEAMRYLTEGCNQIQQKMSFLELGEVVENLDGIIGWATFYGWLRSQKIGHKKALERVTEEGKVIALREFQHFLESRKAKQKYTKILRYFSQGKNSWNELRISFSKDKIKLMESQLALYLKELQSYGFIEKFDAKYYISDPLLVKAIQ